VREQPALQDLVVTSPAKATANPRRQSFQIVLDLLRATPRRRPISRVLTPSWRSRNRYRNCRIVSSRFAGIPISRRSSTSRECAVADCGSKQSEPINRSVAGFISECGGFKSEPWPLRIGIPPACVGIRRRSLGATGCRHSRHQRRGLQQAHNSSSDAIATVSREPGCIEHKSADLHARSHATKRSKPGRATVPLADRPRSSSMISTSTKPCWRLHRPDHIDAACLQVGHHLDCVDWRT